MKAGLVIIDDSDEVRTTLEGFFEEVNEVKVLGTAKDGIEGIELITKCNPTVVILDLIMPRLDGFGVLKALRAGKSKPKIIVLSALGADCYVEQAHELGADYFMMKPYDILELKEKVVYFSRQAENLKTPRRDKGLDEKLSNIFITVGIPAHIKGYQFLREAIKMAIDTPEIINCITKRLYPNVAEKFETTASKVERAIRHAIEVAWNRGKIENINNLFGIRVYGSHEKPTNGEFIALVADKMLIEGA